MSANVGRNDPCPCGSGLKYKQCHEGKLRLNLKGRRGWVLGALGLVVVAAVAWGLMRSQPRPTTSGGMGMTPPSTSANAGTAPGTGAVPSPVTGNPTPLGTGAPTMPGPAVAAPQAWSYDAATNRHFDPRHGHWHDGPPPPPEARGIAGAQPPFGQLPVPGVAGAAPSGPTPAPWTYDPKTNRHWHPEHAHWHDGPPPPGAR